ncbi:MAG: ATP-binding protein [bacterium]
MEKVRFENLIPGKSVIVPAGGAGGDLIDCTDLDDDVEYVCRNVTQKTPAVPADGAGLADIRAKRAELQAKAEAENARWLEVEAVQVTVMLPSECPLADSLPTSKDSRYYQRPFNKQFHPAGHDCTRCAVGMTFEKRDSASMMPRIVYRGQRCYQTQRTARLVNASGLVQLCMHRPVRQQCTLLGSLFHLPCGNEECEIQHEFSRAVIDDNNRTAYTELQQWTPGEVITDEQGNLTNTNTGSVYIYGPVGTGKSYLLHCMTRALCAQGVKAYCGRVADFFAEIRRSYDNKNPGGNAKREDEIIEFYSSVRVLLWDDLGTEGGKQDWAGGLMYRLIDNRWKMHLPVVITSNFTLAQACARYGEDFGPRLESRLAGMCQDYYYELARGGDRRIRG